MITKEVIIEHYINQNKSISQMCKEYGITKKFFTHKCKKFGIIKSITNRIKASTKAGYINNEEFIRRAKLKHSNKYDYSLVKYVGNKIPIEIRCLKHGIFLQKPVTHLQGYGCQICGGSKPLTFDDFISKSKEIHGNKYDYSEAIFKNVKVDVTIICKVHGPFKQKPYKHYNGQGCPKCNKNEQLTTDLFIQRAIDIHGDYYDYSMVDYKNIDAPISIICPTHGKFRTTPYLHLRHKCKKCMMKEKGNPDYQDAFIKRAKEVHNGKYNYDKVEYFNSFTYVTIICPIHGEFKQAPFDHLQGKGCGQCAGNIKLNTEEFVKRSKITHGDKYDYSLSEYKLSHEKVIIICRNHGPFDQVAISHYRGHGCPKCPRNVSKPQQEIADHVNIPGIIFNDRKLISPSEIDLLIEPMKLGIEHHGIFWHSYDYVESKDERHKHKVKQDRAEERGFRLLQIFEHEWMWKKDIVKSRINIILGRGDKVFARKCKVVELDNNSFNDFCEANHLQGRLFSKVRYGLAHDGKLVMAVGFNGGPDFVCTRLCSALNLIVVGGVSKLFKRFVCDHNPKTVLSFADRRYSMGRIYEMLGFRRLYVTDPNYFYVRGLRVYSRMRFQKHKQRRVLELFDESASEAENMFMNGYRRLWDAGHIKYMWGNICGGNHENRKGFSCY